MKNYTDIIWDFNGTILDDVSLGVEAANALLLRYGKKPIKDIAEYQQKFCFPVIDYYERLGLERENFDKYAVEWVAEYNLREPDAGIYDGIRDMLDYFAVHGKTQYLVSATERNMLEKQVGNLNIRQYFAMLIGQDDIKAHGKLAAAVEWSKKVRPKSPLLIGDSIHDFEVAQAIGADCVLLSWGHQSKERLLDCGCPVYDNIRLLQKAFEG